VGSGFNRRCIVPKSPFVEGVVALDISTWRAAWYEQYANRAAMLIFSEIPTPCGIWIVSMLSWEDGMAPQICVF